MADENFSRTFFLCSLLALLGLSIIIILPLLTVILSAGIIAYLISPVYKYLVSKLKNKHVAAWIIVLFVIVVITIPTYYTATAVTKEGYNLFITVKQALSGNSVQERDCVASPQPFCQLSNQIVSYLKKDQVKFYIEDSISKISTFIINKASELIINIPNLVIDVFIMLFLIYYFLVEGTALIAKAKKSIPLKVHHIDHIIKEFDNFTYATIYGHFITACAQGVIGGLIFFFLGLPTPILAGLGMTFFGFVPFLGTPIVWLPVVITLFLAGETSKAIILLLLGTFVISTIDNILRPYIVGQRTRLPAVAVLVGIFGGIYTMGIIGIIAGPLILSLFISFIDVYYKEGY